MNRQYRQKRRAEQQQQTRQRIVEAAMELHQDVGPSETSIRAIAKRAGVQRLTVYRHFPDERSLFLACSAHYAERHPMPSFDRWLEIKDPESRTRTALHELYAYYERTEPMLTKIFRDVSRVPAVAEVFQRVSSELSRGQEILVDGWSVDDHSRRLLIVAIGHAMSFQTWQSLVRQQEAHVNDAIELMVTMIRIAASGSPQMSG